MTFHMEKFCWNNFILPTSWWSHIWLVWRKAGGSCNSLAHIIFWTFLVPPLPLISAHHVCNSGLQPLASQMDPVYPFKPCLGALTLVTQLHRVHFDPQKERKELEWNVSYTAVVATSLIPGHELLDTMKILTIPVMGMPVVVIRGLLFLVRTLTIACSCWTGLVLGKSAWVCRFQAFLLS